MLEKHGVGRAELGNLIEASADEVASERRESFLREIRGLAINDCLGRVNICDTRYDKDHLHSAGRKCYRRSRVGMGIAPLRTR